MKRTKILLKFLFVIFFATILLPVSCIKEKVPIKFDNNPELSLSVIVPISNRPVATVSNATKAMTEDDQYRIQEIDVLLFNQTTGICESIGRCSGTDIKQDAVNFKKKNFTVSVSRLGNYDIVLLANARSLTSVSSDLIGKTKDIIYEQYLILENSDKWPTDGSRPIPMWGELEDLDIKEYVDISSTPIIMSRMLARVDISIEEDALSNFKLSSVRLYNTNSKGSLVPSPGLWNKSDPSAPYATAPTVPNSSVLSSTPLLYDGLEVADTDCLSEIFMFEAENHISLISSTPKSLLERTCLVIGGVYDANANGNFTDDGPETFYRLDFSTGNGATQLFLDILRNHLYKFSIKKVSNIGYATPQLAFESTPMNIESEVLEWNEAQIGDIYFNENNYLSIEPGSEIKFNKKGASKNITISTNYTGGWELLALTQLVSGVEESVTNGWLQTDKTVGQKYGGGAEKINIKVTVTNNTTSARTGFVKIKAGRLEAKIKITQSVEDGLLIETTNSSGTLIDELVFTSKSGVTPSSQVFKVNWLPKNSDLFVHLEASGDAPFYNGGGAPIAEVIVNGNSGTGTKTYTISPEAITELDQKDGPVLVKSSIVTFFVLNDGITESKSIHLKQIGYYFNPIAPPTFILNGKSIPVSIKSNFRWKIQSVSDSYNILRDANSLIDMEGEPSTTSGVLFNVPMVYSTGNMSKDNMKATITFAAVDNPSTTFNMQITANDDALLADALYIGWFGGKLEKDANDKYKFTKQLYLGQQDLGTLQQKTASNTTSSTKSYINGKTNTYYMVRTSALRSTHPAAQACNNLNETANTDLSTVDDPRFKWYLPSIKGLNAVYGVLTAIRDDANLSGIYWSSTEHNTSNPGSAYYFDFTDFSSSYKSKITEHKVRPVIEL